MSYRILNIWNGEDGIEYTGDLIDILKKDDVEEFDEFVSVGDTYVEYNNYQGLLDLCLEQHAIQCTLHLLEGNLPNGPPDVSRQRVYICEPSDMPALFRAVTHMWVPQVYHLLINHCGAHRHANYSLYGCLPLHFLLHTIVDYNDHLSHWSLDNSLIKLLLQLFLLPGLKPKLECARIVAEATDSINEVAWSFIQHGEVIQLASLLLVSPERAMAPFSSGETIKQQTSLEWIASHAHRAQCSKATFAAAGLLDIFDRAGYALAYYYQCMPVDDVVEVSVQVAQILHKAGFKVTYKDFDLEGIYNSCIRDEVLRSIHERLDIAFDDTFKNFQMRKMSLASLPMNFHGGPSPKGCRAQEAAKLEKLQHLGSRGYKYSWAYHPSLMDLSNLTMKLRRGARLL